MQNTAQRFNVPAGFSGWWCVRCEAAQEIPDEAGSPARCPHCHKWTVWWIPGGNVEGGMGNDEVKAKRQPAGRALASEMAGAEWERKMPRPERARELFAHMKDVIEHPETEPDLRKIEQQEYKR